MSRAAYDKISVNYSDFRRAEPRIETKVWAALRDASSVVNVGAGTGSYEPPSRCRDEFTSALWDRPEMFLEPATLRASSLGTGSPRRRSSAGRSACAPTSRAAAGTRCTATSAPCRSSTSACG